MHSSFHVYEIFSVINPEFNLENAITETKKAGNCNNFSIFI